MDTKTEKVKMLVACGEFQEALSIARTFKRWESKEDKDAVELASEVKAHASFYRQLGKNVGVEYQKGVEVLVRYYGSVVVNISEEARR